MSDIVGAKAISLVSRGGVRELTHARTFEVDGSGGNSYVVVITARYTSCTCEAGQHDRRCYHVAAAKLVMAQREEEQRQEAAIAQVRRDPTAKGPKWVGANGKHYASSSLAAASFLKAP